MIDKEDPKLVSLLMEYNDLGAIRRQYMAAYLQTNFYFGILIVVIGGSLAYNQHWTLLIAPLIVFIQMSIVQWNQYHHFLTEEYLCRLERRIRDYVGLVDEGVLYHGFYRSLFYSTTYLRKYGSPLVVIKPTALLAINLAIFNVLIILFCVWYGRSDFIEMFGTWAYNGYTAILLVLFVLLVYNFLMLPKNIRRIIDEYLERHVAEDIRSRSSGAEHSPGRKNVSG